MGGLEMEALLRKGYAAMAAGDGAAVVDMFSPEGVFHVNGLGPLRGDHRGHGAIGATLGKLFEWTAGTLRMEVEEVFADDNHGVVVVRESATRARDGATLNARETHLFRFDAATGLVLDLWDIPAAADKAAHDAFFS